MYPYDPARYPDNTVEPADVNATIQLVKDEVAYYVSLTSPYPDYRKKSGGSSGNLELKYFSQI